MTGNLYIVATPIGNLEDITERALKVLKDVDVILAEDNRKTGIMLKRYDIKKDIMNYFQHSGEEKKLEILNLLLSGKNLALVTDAGTPGLSDPGNELIDYLIPYSPDLHIIPIPGPSAVTAALSVSGFNLNKFVFLGFLPKKKRNKLLEWIKEGKISFAFYESPNRIIASLELLRKVFGDYRQVFVGRELTKVHETLYRGNFTKVINALNEDRVRGELVVIVE